MLTKRSVVSQLTATINKHIGLVIMTMEKLSISTLASLIKNSCTFDRKNWQ